MKVGCDNWCPTCAKWMPFNNKGNCKSCGKHIDISPTSHGWLEIYGVDFSEVDAPRQNF